MYYTVQTSGEQYLVSFISPTECHVDVRIRSGVKKIFVNIGWLRFLVIHLVHWLFLMQGKVSRIKWKAVVKCLSRDQKNNA